MREVEGPGFFAVIKSATLTEISLTDTPSNPEAKVMERYRTSPQVELLDLMTYSTTIGGAAVRTKHTPDHECAHRVRQPRAAGEPLPACAWLKPSSAGGVSIS